MKKILNFLLILFFFVFAAAALKEAYPFWKSESACQSLRQKVIRQEESGKQDTVSGNLFRRKINFSYLQQVNPDIRGWIYIPDTGIDYPILTGKNDETYLFRDYLGDVSKIGSIFTYSEVNPDSDIRIFLFGHNMISGQMFSPLKKYRKQDYADLHGTMYLYTLHTVKECRFLSVSVCESTDSVFKNQRNDSEDIPKQILLVTCDGYENTSRRLVVLFEVIREMQTAEE